MSSDSTALAVAPEPPETEEERQQREDDETARANVRLLGEIIRANAAQLLEDIRTGRRPTELTVGAGLVLAQTMLSHSKVRREVAPLRGRKIPTRVTLVRQPLPAKPAPPVVEAPESVVIVQPAEEPDLTAGIQDAMERGVAAAVTESAPEDSQASMQAAVLRALRKSREIGQ